MIACPRCKKDMVGFRCACGWSRMLRGAGTWEGSDFSWEAVADEDGGLRTQLVPQGSMAVVDDEVESC